MTRVPRHGTSGKRNNQRSGISLKYHTVGHPECNEAAGLRTGLLSAVARSKASSDHSYQSCESGHRSNSVHIQYAMHVRRDLKRAEASTVILLEPSGFGADVAQTYLNSRQR